MVFIPAVLKAIVQEQRKQRQEHERAAFFAENGVTLPPGGKGLARRDIAKLRKAGAIT